MHYVNEPEQEASQGSNTPVYATAAVMTVATIASYYFAGGPAALLVGIVGIALTIAACVYQEI